MLTVLVLLLIGVAAGRWRALPDSTARVLDALVINVSLPALVIALVPDLEASAAAAVPVAVAWSALLVSAVVVLALARALGWSRRTTGTLLLVVPLGNTSFLGIPAVEQLLSVDHVPYALLYDQLGSFLALATYGALVAGAYGSADRPSSRDIVRRVASFPPFAALVVAALLWAVGTPDLVGDVAGRLGATVTPLAMLAVGMRVRMPTWSGTAPTIAVGLAVKMLAVPALAYVAARAIGDGGTAWDTSVLEAAMPPMVSASIVAIEAGLDDELAAGTVGLGVVLAMLTLPIWASLL